MRPHGSVFKSQATGARRPTRSRRGRNDVGRDVPEVSRPVRHGPLDDRGARAATDDELKTARWKVLRALGQKGYARIRTSLGDLNVEVHCDMVPRAAEKLLAYVGTEI